LPIAAAFPADREPPIVLDMATTVVAGGKLRLAAKKGKPIPPDWAMDREGRPTTDPEEAIIHGFFQWTGGYKGFGIAPAEIEALLFEHPGVLDVAVIGKPDPEAGEVPKAFVVRKDSALTAEALLAWARGRLAGYKTLHEVQFVDAIPKTASGKILRRVLKEEERKRLGIG
jgi:hypothetical protein